jgi:hypothetical protein
MDKLGIIHPGITPQPGAVRKTAEDKDVTAEQLDDGLLLDLSNAVESRTSKSRPNSPGADSVRKTNDV